jgi:hypothetical protein
MRRGRKLLKEVTLTKPKSESDHRQRQRRQKTNKTKEQPPFKIAQTCRKLVFYLLYRPMQQLRLTARKNC